MCSAFHQSKLGNSKMRVLPALIAASAATSALAFQPAATERPTTALSASAADRRSILTTVASAISTAALLSVSTPQPASARLEAVNRPDLLPTESGKNVIQVSMLGIGAFGSRRCVFPLINHYILHSTTTNPLHVHA